MNDLISRQAAIDVCNKAIDLWQGQLGEGIVIAVRKKIEELPSVQPERKTGKLIYESAYNWFRCNVCKKIYPPEFLQYFDSCQYQPGFNFCPNCGAKMDEVETNETCTSRRSE